MKRLSNLFLGIIFCLFFVSCEKKEEAYVKINNPFIEVESIKEVSKIAGFDINVPEDMFSDKYEMEIRVMPDKLIEIIYKGMEEWITIRKGIYEGENDISGDYNEYPDIKREKYKNSEVVFKGMDDKINVALWADKNYVYSVDINTGGVGKDYNTIKELISKIN